MYIYMDNTGLDVLERVAKLKRVNHYTMLINGWYGGGFSAPSDTKALEIFNRILEAEKAIAEEIAQ